MGLGLVLTTAKGRGDVAVERLASLARLLGVAGELAWRRTARECGGGETLGHGGSLRACEIGRGGAARRLAARAGSRWQAQMAVEEARARVSCPEAEREAAYGRGRGGREKIGFETKRPPTEMTSRTHASVERRMNRR
jgi:hypothetical protein